MLLIMSDHLKNNSSLFIEISQVFILNENKLLMQLRDFNPFIVHPGHWGFFAGHWEAEETAEVAMMRELKEELCWMPKSIDFVGSIIVEGNRRIHVHKCHLDIKYQKLNLQEGQEIGEFTMNEITENSLYSKKWSKNFPISPISAKVFQHYIYNN